MHTPHCANILLSGPCNLRCPDCIGHQLSRPLPDNLTRWPLAGFDDFVAALHAHDIKEIALSGTNTEPLCYRHHDGLLAALRQRVPGCKLSLHTNGVLAVARADLVNQFDRVSLSLPSLVASTCLAITGCAEPLDLFSIRKRVAVPLKISTLLTPHNIGELPALAATLRALGVTRWVLRQRVGDTTRWPLHAPGGLLEGRAPRGWFADNPVYELDGLEVTVWRFERTDLPCINLFSDGTISSQYLLGERRRKRAA